MSIAYTGGVVIANTLPDLTVLRNDNRYNSFLGLLLPHTVRVWIYGTAMFAEALEEP